MFSFLKNALQNIYNQFTSKINSLFSREVIDEDTLSELERILISADTGVHTTRTIIEKLKNDLKNKKITKGSDLKISLGQQLKEILELNKYDSEADVYLLVGINGSGKTTFSSKLANWLKNKGKTVLFVAADTFRAAATEQLSQWAKKLNVQIVVGKENQDPAAVVYSGCDQFKTGKYDALIIDTAGRLQTKTNLMKEIEKVKKTINKQLPDKKISTLLTIDSMLGQNSFDQAKIFNESTKLDGIVLTKLDGTGKGGIVFSISKELNIPVAFISFGEQIDKMQIFDPKEYVDQLLNK